MADGEISYEELPVDADIEVDLEDEDDAASREATGEPRASGALQPELPATLSARSPYISNPTVSDRRGPLMG